jgi:hypothetical protein
VFNFRRKLLIPLPVVYLFPVFKLDAVTRTAPDHFVRVYHGFIVRRE